MIRLDSRTRYAAFILILALLASLAVGAFRLRTESHANRVELAMDFGDFISTARSYNYNPAAFLIALRRAGLTSLALGEELGGNIGGNGLAYATTGAALLNQSRLTPLSDPLLQQLARANKLSRDAVYIIVYDRATYDRYRKQLPLHFEPKTIRVLRTSQPWIIEVRTQIDYFNNIGLGIPADQLALAKRLHLLVVARFQNDERFTKPQMQAEFDDAVASGARISDVVFFGLGNEVFGYPDHLPDAAEAFREHFEKTPHPFNFGSIEVYDTSQIQKGNDTLARLIPGQTVRVQAVAKTDYDKIKLDELIGRFVLGVRERNIRVAYLRPWTHQEGDLSIEATNVKMVKDLADELKSHGIRLGRATPIPGYRGNDAILVGIATLAVPSIFVLLLGWFGWYRPSWAVAAYVLTELLYLAGVLSHHEMFARSVIALAGALLFAAAAFAVVAPAFYEEPAPRFGDQIVRSLGWMVVATAVALLGALVVVGIMSSPLAMEEIERFRGVRALYVCTPLIALCMYLFTKRYNAGTSARQVFGAPITLYQLLVGIIVIAAGALLVMRSGNTSDVQPSNIELAMRHVLSHVLSVRPRTKEFLIGAPLLMLTPALFVQHRRWVGWLLALGIGVGIGDVIDTFSHLHTPVIVSLERIGNGVAIGAIVGILAIWIYRRACIALGLLRVR
ncbi:MAG: hypothetical protein JO322_02760 [Candidatus Eremiobacteraeota bacterium]|nr:hypothetical protein [Candidatus Eremiobacteraeota bacterium]